MNFKNSNVLIITKPIGKAGVAPLFNLYSILKNIYNDVFLITGGEGSEKIIQQFPNDETKITSIVQVESNNLLVQFLRHQKLQADISLAIIKRSKDVSDIFFLLDAHALILPVIVSKMLRKRTFFVIAAWIYGSYKIHPDLFHFFLVISEKICFQLADHIILYSDRLIETWGMEKYKEKIITARQHRIDPVNFHSISPFESRNSTIAYIGRLAEGKGIREFLLIAKMITSRHPDLTFWVIGDGPLAPLVQEFQRENASEIRMEFLGWVNNSELSGLLNQIKIVILLSQSEGLPNVLLEAMACGVVVMATPVGAIPDILQNRNNGFLVEKDNLDGVAEIVLDILQNPDMAKGISKNAEEFIQENFNFKAVCEQYRKSLESIETGG